MSLGIVPKLQSACLALPLPSGIKSILSHPAGPFTSNLSKIKLKLVFFWAPTFKWMITISNIGDMKKPAENLSANQQLAIFSTGVIWARYS